MQLDEALAVYPIITPSVVDGDLFTFCEALLEGGARIVQLRHKDVGSRQFFEDAVALVHLCDRAGARLIVNDRVDIALAARAHGVHLGPGDLPISEARRIMGADLVIGASAGSREAARDAQEQGADYLGCGAVYDASASKADASQPRGADFIEAIAGAVTIPFVGIGGISVERAPEVIAAGADGVAVIRAVAEDPARAVAALLEAVRAKRLDH